MDKMKQALFRKDEELRKSKLLPGTEEGLQPCVVSTLFPPQVGVGETTVEQAPMVGATPAHGLSESTTKVDKPIVDVWVSKKLLVENTI